MPVVIGISVDPIAEAVGGSGMGQVFQSGLGLALGEVLITDRALIVGIHSGNQLGGSVLLSLSGNLFAVGSVEALAFQNIYQILYNICDNGIKFSKNGGKYVISIKEKGI